MTLAKARPLRTAVIRQDEDLCMSYMWHCMLTSILGTTSLSIDYCPGAVYAERITTASDRQAQ